MFPVWRLVSVALVAGGAFAMGFWWGRRALGLRTLLHELQMHDSRGYGEWSRGMRARVKKALGG